MEEIERVDVSGKELVYEHQKEHHRFRLKARLERVSSIVPDPYHSVEGNQVWKTTNQVAGVVIFTEGKPQ